MPTQYIKRGATPGPSAGTGRSNAAPVYVDSDDNKLKIIAAGAGSTTEAEIFDTIRTFTAGPIRSGFTTQFGHDAKVGATAGWVLGAANDLPYVATMAASQTGGTLVLPLDHLQVGATITGYRIVAQVESGGNAVTIDAALRATTNVAAEPTDAAITGGAIAQVSVTADTAVSQAVTGISEVVTSGKTYYVLVTATTTASTDIILQACEVTVTSA